MLRGSRVGTETAALSRTGSGWRLSGSGRLGMPFDVIITRFEVTYANDWQPVQLQMQGSVKGQGMGLATTFGLTTAMNDMTQGGERGSSSHQIAARSVVLPSSFFASYEILAARIGVSPVGTRVPVYVAPEGGTNVTIDAIEPRQVSIGQTTLDLRVFTLSLEGASAASRIELWLDARNRLARLEMPAVSVVVVRDDLASIMAREVPVRNTRDEDVFIPANGFNLGATVTPPAGTSKGAPSVVLVAGVGPQDRDMMVYGVPIFGQLAGALSDAGYFVVRYDGRGVGRSGGRTENATLTEYADDVVRTIKWLHDRDDVDDDRMAVVAYGSGGPIAMLAASREDDIKALALLAAPGRSGSEVTLEQQAQVLASMGLSAVERSTRIDLQQRVIQAALTGRGWETIPPEVRAQADTPWFRSWLSFDPAATMRKLDQPVLIVQGALDTENPPDHADRLATLSSARKDGKIAPTYTRKVVIPGINHLLVPARTGNVDEYDTLPDANISPDVSAAIASWLDERLPPR